MAVQEGFGGLRRVGLHEAAVAVGQVDDEAVGLPLHAANDHQGLAEVALGVSRRMGQWDEHLLALTAIFPHVVLDRGVSAVEPVFVPQPLEDALGIEFVIRRGERPHEIAAEAEGSINITYQQDWPAYNAAQIHEGEHFVTLLRALCDTVPQPEYTFGRPRLPLSDMLFGMGIKVYSTMSGRRAMSDIWSAEAKGLLEKAPSFTSVFRYMENPDMKDLLESLIEQSALPLASVEHNFAPDSSGFATSAYHRWFSHKHGREIKEAKWVKGHIMCGVETNIVTAADVTEVIGNDSPYLIPFLDTTAQHFDVWEVSADKAYLSKKNLRAVHEAGATPTSRSR